MRVRKDKAANEPESVKTLERRTLDQTVCERAGAPQCGAFVFLRLCAAFCAHPSTWLTSLPRLPIQAHSPPTRTCGHRVQQLLVYVFATVLALVASPAAAGTAARVLTPDVGPQIEAAFARAEPTFHLKDAQIKPLVVEARVCRPDNACLDVRLTPVDATCAGRALSSWCVQFPGGTPADAQVLFDALDERPPWLQSAAPQFPTNSSALDLFVLFAQLLIAVPILLLLRQRRVPRKRAFLLLTLCVFQFSLWRAAPNFFARSPHLATSTWLLIWWLWPLSMGATIGLFFRWGTVPKPAGRLSALATVLAVPLLFAAQAVQWQRIGAMDGAAMGLVAALAGLAVGHTRFANPKPWLLSAASFTLALVFLEIAARIVLPPPPAIEHQELSLLNRDSPRPDHLPVAAGHALVHCALHGSVGEETSRCLRLDALPHDKPWLLHVGDSMLFGSGVERADALPAQLAKLLPQVAHLNAGVPGTSIDIELALLLRVLKASSPSAVVLYVMPGNDVDEVETPVESCNNALPLDVKGASPQLRCTEAVWPSRPWSALFLQSRLPLPIAGLTDVSWTARQLVWLQHLALEPPKAHDPQPTGDVDAYRRYLAVLAAHLRSAHIPLQLVVMPLRRSAYGAHTEARRAQIHRVLQGLQLPFLDMQPAVDAWVQSHGEAAIFLTQPPGDIHLSAKGLTQLAIFLAPQLILPQGHTPTE